MYPIVKMIEAVVAVMSADACVSSAPYCALVLHWVCRGTVAYAPQAQGFAVGLSALVQLCQDPKWELVGTWPAELAQLQWRLDLGSCCAITHCQGRTWRLDDRDREKL